MSDCFERYEGNEYYMMISYLIISCISTKETDTYYLFTRKKRNYNNFSKVDKNKTLHTIYRPDMLLPHAVSHCQLKSGCFQRRLIKYMIN